MSGTNFFLDKSDPASWRALNGLALKVADAAEQAGLPRSIIELVNVRISQLNGCAFCLDLHDKLLLHLEESLSLNRRAKFVASL